MAHRLAQAHEAQLRRDRTGSAFQIAERIQRRRMVVDVAAADLAAAEALLGPFHPTSWHFRAALAQARLDWDRLRAELGSAAISAALEQPPRTTITLHPAGPGAAPALLIPISGQTYRAERVAGTPLAPIQWRLTPLATEPGTDPYYACRLRDGSTQCDCADWTFRAAQTDPPGQCKHLAALMALRWM